MVDAALSKYGRLDILVNNAGIFDELIPVGEVSDDLWYKVMETNLNAPMRGIRKVIPILKTRRWGHCQYSLHCRIYRSTWWWSSLCSFQTRFNRIDQKCGVQL